jgi:hypothetical protein
MMLRQLAVRVPPAVDSCSGSVGVGRCRVARGHRDPHRSFGGDIVSTYAVRVCSTCMQYVYDGSPDMVLVVCGAPMDLPCSDC